MISRLFKSKKKNKPKKKNQTKNSKIQNKILRQSKKKKAVKYGKNYRCCFHLTNGNRCNKNALGEKNGKFIVHCKNHNEKCLNKYIHYKKYCNKIYDLSSRQKLKKHEYTIKAMKSDVLRNKMREKARLRGELRTKNLYKENIQRFRVVIETDGPLSSIGKSYRV